MFNLFSSLGVLDAHRRTHPLPSVLSAGRQGPRTAWAEPPRQGHRGGEHHPPRHPAQGGVDNPAAVDECQQHDSEQVAPAQLVEAPPCGGPGRARYQRAVDVCDARAGSRNGFCPTTVKTTAGPASVARAKLRGTTEKIASRLFGTGATRTNALESLAIAGYVRGLSDRDVEATLADALGAEAALSRSTVSRVCEAIKAEFAGWAERSLAGIELDYLFLDGSFLRR